MQRHNPAPLGRLESSLGLHCQLVRRGAALRQGAEQAAVELCLELGLAYSRGGLPGQSQYGLPDLTIIADRKKDGFEVAPLQFGVVRRTGQLDGEGADQAVQAVARWLQPPGLDEAQ